MKIVIAGGSGQLGTILARAFHEKGSDVVVLSRNEAAAPWRVAKWNPSRSGWQADIDGADVAINLAGRSVNCRYHAANRREMIDSRLESTRALGKAIQHAARPPRLWLQMSTATIYAHRYDAANDEEAGIIGGDEPGVPETWRFSVELAKAWERAAIETETSQTRKVLMRASMVMSPDKDGVFDVLMGLVRKGLGGKNGDGRQFVSWIHDVDFVRAVDWLIAREDLSGAINIASPNPLPNTDFMRALRHAAGARIGLPATNWMLELGAFFLRTETELILKSRRVIPRRLTESGFTFHHPSWADAARDLVQRHAASRKGK